MLLMACILAGAEALKELSKCARSRA